MNKFNINTLAVAIGLAFSTGAMAIDMSKAEYTGQKDAIAAEFKSAKANCGEAAANAKDICIAKAQGSEKIAKAELEARYKPTEKSHFQVRVAKAEAAYAVAKEECDDKAGNVKDVCVKQAKAAETSAKADAKAQMKITKATGTASETAADARTKANVETTDARKEAATDKRDAAYTVAKEKCDAFASDAKDRCIAEAKARYGKS